MNEIHDLLGDEAENLLTHTAQGVPREDLVLPGHDFVDRVVAGTDRSPQVLRNLQSLFAHGRLAAPGMCRSSRSTRASNTLRRRRSPRTLATSTPRTSLNSPLTAVATRSPVHSACSEPCRGATRTRSPSS